MTHYTSSFKVGDNSTAKSVTPCVLRSNPVRILAWELLVIGLGVNSAGMALVDPQMVEVGSSAEQVTINLNLRNNFIANDSKLRFAAPRR